MTRKNQLNYVLRAVYQKEECTKKELKDYCISHKVAADENVFLDLLKELNDRGCIDINNENSKVFFKKPLCKDHFAAGMNFFGTKEKVFYVPD